MLNEYIIDDEVIDRTKLTTLLDEYKDLFNRHRRIMVYSKKPLPVVLALILCEQLSLSLYLCHGFFSVDEVQEYKVKYDIDLFISDDQKAALSFDEVKEPAQQKGQGHLHIFTTGTTGKPKLARHTWNTISDAASHGSQRLVGKRWLMAYNHTTFAGLQVYFAALRSGGILIFVTSKDLELTARSIVKHKVDMISATPTFWRMLVNSWPKSLEKPTLEQVTMGGEIIPQDIIDLCSTFFSPQKLTHIYGSTEAGSVIAVSDRKAGFPVSFLYSEGKVKLRIAGGILEVNSRTRMQGYVGIKDLPGQGDWISTGDVVEIRGDRVYFIGRDDGTINIGGNKVRPEEVEDALIQLNEVKDCVAYEKRNPIVGSLLAANIVLQPNSDISVAEIKNRLGSILAGYKIPQYYKFIDYIRMCDNGKKIRN